MKRRIVITCLLLISFSFLMSDINLGIGMDLPGNHEFSGNGNSIDRDSKMGFEVFAEYLAPLSEASGMNIEGGIGAAYLLPRGLDNEIFKDATFSFIPLYLLGQVSTSGEGNIFFGKLRAGYDLFSGNDDYSGDNDLNGGLFLGFGGGIIMSNNIFAELSYQILNGGDDEMDLKESHLSILVGFKIK